MTPFSVSPAAVHLANRCFDDSLPALDRLLFAASLQGYLADAMQALAAVAREEEGHSWADVGAVLSITKQAAHQRLSADVPVLDETGAYASPETAPAAYVQALRAAHDQLSQEDGQDDRGRRLLGAGLRHFGEGVGEIEREYLEDARDALIDAGGREEDVARINRALVGVQDSGPDVPVVVPVEVPFEVEVEVRVPAKD